MDVASLCGEIAGDGHPGSWRDMTLAPHQERDA
jgi:hypothetical protein